jgi:hypothetical protein
MSDCCVCHPDYFVRNPGDFGAQRLWIVLFICLLFVFCLCSCRVSCTMTSLTRNHNGYPWNTSRCGRIYYCFFAPLTPQPVGCLCVKSRQGKSKSAIPSQCQTPQCHKCARHSFFTPKKCSDVLRVGKQKNKEGPSVERGKEGNQGI